MQDNFHVVFGDDWIALYRNGELVVEGVSLSFGDVLEAVRVPVTLQDAELEWAHNRQGFPKLLGEIPFEVEEASS